MNQLAILFAGQSITAETIDRKKIEIFIRALPQRYLVRIIECAEFNHALVELCSYLKAEETEILGGESAWPDIPAPVGLKPVPAGYADNLTDASIKEITRIATELNFQRAVEWAQGRMAASKVVAPLHEMAMTQVLPIVDRVMNPLMKKLDQLSNSMPSAPQSSDAQGRRS